MTDATADRCFARPEACPTAPASQAGVCAGGPAVSYRAALRLGAVAYAAGDRGTLVRVSDPNGRPVVTIVDLGTTCTLRSLFARGDDLWIVGSDGGRAGIWRLSGGTVFRWGQCP